MGPRTEKTACRRDSVRATALYSARRKEKEAGSKLASEAGLEERGRNPIPKGRGKFAGGPACGTTRNTADRRAGGPPFHTIKDISLTQKGKSIYRWTKKLWGGKMHSYSARVWEEELMEGKMRRENLLSKERKKEVNRTPRELKDEEGGGKKGFLNQNIRGTI